MSQAQPTDVGPDRAAELSAQGAFLLDVREPHEWEAGHVEGSVHIPLGELQARQDEVPTDRPIVAMCRSGARSGRAAAAFRMAGFDVLNLAGGLMAWAAAGLPLVKDASADPSTPPTVA